MAMKNRFINHAGTSAGPAATKTTTLYSTTNSTYATYNKASEILFIEGDFKAGHTYRIGRTSDLTPVLFDAGYSAWYWNWRRDTYRTENQRTLPRNQI
ncbi:MAG: hypothetical protein LBP74_08210 [Treponema sp.]|nr:hypothetical protein [Treponema sp.]